MFDSRSLHASCLRALYCSTWKFLNGYVDQYRLVIPRMCSALSASWEMMSDWKLWNMIDRTNRIASMIVEMPICRAFSTTTRIMPFSLS